MSDSEEDYMSDKLLLGCKDNDIRPGLILKQSQKREFDLYKKKKELEIKKPKKQHVVEAELREKGLNTAISSDNIGFKLLQKMGFQAGSSLGKSQTGIKEPIQIKLKSNKTGLGVETKIKEIVHKKFERKENTMIKKLNQFKEITKEKFADKYLKGDFYKCQKVCEEMDFRKEIEDPIEDFYWTKSTIMKRKNISEEDEDEFTLEFMSDICDENLKLIIDYLRTTHLYCVYCGFVADDSHDLTANCPGPYRIDHDDE